MLETHKSCVKYTPSLNSPRFLGQFYCQEKKSFVKVFESFWILMDEKKPLAVFLEDLSFYQQKVPCSSLHIESCSEGLPMISSVWLMCLQNINIRMSHNISIPCVQLSHSTFQFQFSL